MGTNRSRLIVTLGQQWRLYVQPPPAGWIMLGTVQLGMLVGALAETANGELALMRGVAVTPLNQRKARAALDVARATATESPDV